MDYIYTKSIEPWYVLLAMKKMQAFSEEKAIEKQALLKEMQNAGVRNLIRIIIVKKILYK
jgi:hypothetical protein